MRWSYGPDGERTAIGFPDGSGMTFERDGAGLVTRQRHPALGAVDFERDGAGRLVGAVADGTRASWRYERGDLAAYRFELAPYTDRPAGIDDLRRSWQYLAGGVCSVDVGAVRG